MRVRRCITTSAIHWYLKSHFKVAFFIVAISLFFISLSVILVNLADLTYAIFA
jgi:hypothetical protein